MLNTVNHKKKIVIINSNFFDKIIFQKYDLEGYLNNKMTDIEFWKYNTNKIIFKKNITEANRLEDEETNLIKIKNVKKFIKINNLFQLIKNLSKTNSETYIFDLNLMERKPFYLVLLKMFGAKLIFHGLAQFPIQNYHFKDLRRVLKKNILTWPLLFIKAFNFSFKKILRKFFKNNIDIFFYNGLYEKQLSYKISKNSKSLYTRDYQNYLDEKKINRPSMIGQEYILFVDMGYPITHDNDFSLEKPTTTEESYKKGILNFLSFLSKIYSDKKIIVALHPKSKKQDFYGYQSYKDETCHLMKNAFFIVSHDSLSLQFAALWKKPTFIIFNNDMKNRISKFKDIEWFKDELGLPAINMDEINAEELKPIIDRNINNINNSYKFDYFKKQYINDSKEENNSISKTIINTVALH